MCDVGAVVLYVEGGVYLRVWEYLAGVGVISGGGLPVFEAGWSLLQ